MSFFDFLFPKKCLGCGKKGNYFCSSCLKEIEPLHPQVSLGEYPLDYLVSVLPYQGIIRKAILRLKYNFVSDLSDELIDLAVRLFKVNLFDHSNCLTLVPVPLHWCRQNWRGFNQAEILGRKITEKLKIDFCPDLLLRTRPTKPQVKLKGKQRTQNVKGAFKVNDKLHIPKESRKAGTSNDKFRSILLFDDIWTTGATMRECAQVLKEAGVKKVFGLTLAR